MSNDFLDGKNRRDFLKGAAAVSAGMVVASCAAASENLTGTPPFAPLANKSVMNLVTPKMDVVRFGIIGVGQRGKTLLRLLSNIDGSEVKAVCDIDPITIDQSKKIVAKAGRAQPDYYTGSDEAYKKMLERDDIDAVVIATPWRWHTPMAVDSMHAGKHAFTEVPAGITMEDLWKLIEVSERTQLNCMMMENVCYGRSEMMALNMVHQGVLGELLHGEGSYIHELRWQMKEIERKTGSWRTYWHTRSNANLYPTHGLGPIAQYMNINRGDRFDYMTSMASPVLGRDLYAKREFPVGHERRTLKHIAGDMNNTLIKTAKGRSILVQYDTTSPRPYTRLNLIQGTNGTFAGYPDRIAVEKMPEGMPVDKKNSFHKWDKDLAKWHKQFDHPIWKHVEADAKRNGGHGGMDFVMLWRVVYCLRNGLPMDQNVYDAAAWSAIRPLSEESLNNRSKSVDIPDFTRGVWKTAPGLNIAL